MSYPLCENFTRISRVSGECTVRSAGCKDVQSHGCERLRSAEKVVNNFFKKLIPPRRIREATRGDRNRHRASLEVGDEKTGCIWITRAWPPPGKERNAKMKEANMNIEAEKHVNPVFAPGPEPAGLPDAPHEFLSKHELARRLKRALRTVERWQRRRIIPYVKCGHAVMFNWADVVAHLQRNYRVCPQSPSMPARPSRCAKQQRKK